jgi:hypothetical protein
MRRGKVQRPKSEWRGGMGGMEGRERRGWGMSVMIDEGGLGK